MKGRGYSSAQINVALHKLRNEATNQNRTLYGNNQAVYSLLRYGVPVKVKARNVTEAVHLIDWKNPGGNDFALAEEVTLAGNHERRPDVVLYVNGIAIAVLELKNSRVTIGDGIRQCLSNQSPMFYDWFFSTMPSECGVLPLGNPALENCPVQGVLNVRPPARGTRSRVAVTYRRRLLFCPRWTGQNRPFRRRAKPAISDRAETGEFYCVASSVRKSVWTFVRQLRGPHLSTWAWCRSRSSSAVTAAVSPSSLPQSSTGRFDVSRVEARS